MQPDRPEHPESPDSHDSPDYRYLHGIPDIDLPETAGSLDSSELSSRLAGQIGQASLDRLAANAHPELDQHVAAVREAVETALGPRRNERDQWISALVRYASGFVDAATGRGWWPSSAADQALDWESMRLAAVCLMVSEATEPVDEFMIQ